MQTCDPVPIANKRHTNDHSICKPISTLEAAQHLDNYMYIDLTSASRVFLVLVEEAALTSSALASLAFEEAAFT